VEVREPQESLPGQQKLDSRFCVEVPRASVGVDWQLDSTTTDGFIGTVASGTKSAAKSVVKNVASGTTSVVKNVASGTKSVVGTVAAKTKSVVGTVASGTKAMVGLNNIRLNLNGGWQHHYQFDKWIKIDKTKNIYGQINDSFLELCRGKKPWKDVCVVRKSKRNKYTGECTRTKEICPISQVNSSKEGFDEVFDEKCRREIESAENCPDTSDVWLEVNVLIN
jgi:hypothetical protein